MANLRKYWFLWLAAAGAVYWFLTGSTPMMSLAALVGRGRRLATLHQDSSGDGIESVDDLVAAVSASAGRAVSRDACLLACVSASEHWDAGQKEKALMQRIVMNAAADSGDSIESQVTSGKGLGHQAGRWCSTVNGQWEDDLAYAEANLAGALSDDSLGSKHWVHKYGFTSVNGYDDLCASWFAKWNLVPVDIGGVSSCRIFIPKEQVQS